MTHTAPPAAGLSWWRRIITLEPARAMAVVRAALSLGAILLAGFGVAVPDGVEAWAVAAVAAFYVLVEAVTTAVNRAKSTPDAKVAVVVQPDGTVEAGPASPLPTGTVIDAHTPSPLP